MPGKSKAGADRLSRGAIVQAALRLLDQHGMQGLSLTRIADEFGVQPPALYWHIRNRQELFALMADELLFEALADAGPDTVGEAFLVAFGRASARMQVSRRGAAQLLATSPPTDKGRACVEGEIIGRLARGDITRPSEAVMAVFAFTLGWSLLTSHPPMKAHLLSGMKLDETFEAGLLAIAAGFRQQAGTHD